MCCEGVWSAGAFLWECESLKVGTGQPSHPCSVFLRKKQNRKKWGGGEQDAAAANTQAPILGVGGVKCHCGGGLELW